MKFVKNYLNYAVIGGITLILALLSFTGGLPASYAYLFEKISISIILAVSLGLVVGFLGELSLGHASFMCVGAYFGGKIAQLLADALGIIGSSNFLVLILSLIVGAACAALCGFIIGLPALRLRGDYLAIVTLAFGEIVRVIFTNAESFGGAQGMATPRFDKKYLFIVGLVLVLATLAIIQNLLKSKHGRAITAIRDNEIAAKATGINVTKYKLIVFTISSAFAGIAGVLYSYANFNIQPSKFGYNYSIEILVMVVLGGMGSINGSIIAAALITYLNTKLPLILTGDLAVLQNLFYALILIALVIYNNAPALKGFREKYNLRNFWNKIAKPKNDPSRVRDDAARWDVVPTKIEMNEVLSTDIIVDNIGDNSADIGERGGAK